MMGQQKLSLSGLSSGHRKQALGVSALTESIGTDVFWILDPGTQEECGPGLLMSSVVATAIRVSRAICSTWMFIAFAKICGN